MVIWASDFRCKSITALVSAVKWYEFEHMLRGTIFMYHLTIQWSGKSSRPPAQHSAKLPKPLRAAKQRGRGAKAKGARVGTRPEKAVPRARAGAAEVAPPAAAAAT